jgi:uncharacterized membrane protein YccC
MTKDVERPGKAILARAIFPPDQVPMYLVLFSLNIIPAGFMPVLVPNMSYADEAIGILLGLAGGLITWRLTRPRLEAHVTRGEDIRWSSLVWSLSSVLPQALMLALFAHAPRFGLHAGYLLASVGAQMLCYYRWGQRLAG